MTEDTPRSKPNRNRCIFLAYVMGETKAALARKHGISPERVDQIVRKETRRALREAEFAEAADA